MKTPSCAYCNKQWSYTGTFRNLFQVKMNCPHCGKENYYESNSKNSLLTLILAPAVIIIGAFFNISLGWLLGIALLLFLIHFLTFPFRTKVKKAK